jgi:hypothetical protein
MGLAQSHSKMEINMKVTFIMGCCMGRENLYGLMVLYIKASSKIIV